MVAGSARVVDGDSLVVEGRRIRLQGIDAPELGQSCQANGQAYDCGAAARRELVALIGRHDVECRVTRADRYGRDIAVCSAGDIELNREMVRAGWAVAYGGYQLVEGEARADRRGVWAGEFDVPQEWRRVHGGLAEDMFGDGWRGLIDALLVMIGIR